MEPEADTKDWTWTLHRQCPECRLSAGEVSMAELPDRAEAAAAEWVQILTASAGVGIRPRPDVWSPLEYGAHVRDVYQLFDARLALMLVEDEPTFANWDQNESAITGDYASQDPDRVAAELATAAEAFVTRMRGLSEDQYQRVGRRSDGAEFTVTTFCQYFLHDVVHHLWDVTGQTEL
ncbi:DinB family protein [Microlunatus sp. GCM10028923]|uniref:DinB family protein n=1 Tax=Microlunatus sp. GCM10028923 TaxID=3273400 RepID=UPI003612355E